MQLVYLFEIHTCSSIRWLYSLVFLCKEALQERGEGTCLGSSKRSAESRSGGAQTCTSIQGSGFPRHYPSITAGYVFCGPSPTALFFYPYHIRLCNRPEQQRQDRKRELAGVLSGCKQCCLENSWKCHSLQDCKVWGSFILPFQHNTDSIISFHYFFSQPDSLSLTEA